MEIIVNKLSLSEVVTISQIIILMQNIRGWQQRKKVYLNLSNNCPPFTKDPYL